MGDIIVIGTAFVDVKGFARDSYDPAGRNLGSVEVVHGGVGRNVAENLANVGMPVAYVGLLEDTAFGRDVERHLAEAGANLEHVLRVPANGIGMWLAILDEHGDLAGSISKMPEVAPLEELLEQQGEQVFSQAGAVVLELDLSERIAELAVELAQRHGKPVYAIVGNMSVVLARKDLVARTDCFICNAVEAGRFFDDDAIAGFAPEQMLGYLPGAAERSGICSMVVTMGAQGAVYHDGATGVSGICPPHPAEVVDTTGAGDAFFSGTVAGLVMGRPLPEAVGLGARLASATIAHDRNSCPVDRDFLGLAPKL